MKATGIVRAVDNLGRVVLPVELRKTLDINVKDTLEIFTEGEEIILKKYVPGCIFCGEAKGIVNYKGKNICTECIVELNK